MKADRRQEAPPARRRTDRGSARRAPIRLHVTLQEGRLLEIGLGPGGPKVVVLPTTTRFPRETRFGDVVLCFQCLDAGGREIDAANAASVEYPLLDLGDIDPVEPRRATA